MPTVVPHRPLHCFARVVKVEREHAPHFVESEPATIAWFAVRMGPSTFAIFDAFPDEAGRSAHLSGKVAAALMAKAADLFSTPPNIEKVDVLASKLPA